MPQVVRHDPDKLDRYLVLASDGKSEYAVDLHGEKTKSGIWPSCECTDWHVKRNRLVGNGRDPLYACKHIRKVYEYLNQIPPPAISSSRERKQKIVDKYTRKKKSVERLKEGLKDE